MRLRNYIFLGACLALVSCQVNINNPTNTKGVNLCTKSLGSSNPLSGQLDTSWGNQGKFLQKNVGTAFSAAYQSTGYIISISNPPNSNATMVFRLDCSGAIDPNFGVGGYFTLLAGTFDNPTVVVVQSDDKIIVGGSTLTASTASWYLFRLTPNGSIDSSFGTNGLIVTNWQGNSDFLKSIKLQPDGKIVAAGGSKRSDGDGYTTVYRYNTDGTLDNTFASGGVFRVDQDPTLSVAEYVSDLAILPDGSMILAGAFGIGIFVMKITAAGAIDTTFATNGAFQGMYTGSSVGSLFIYPDGKILVAGLTDAFTAYGFAIWRFLANGSLDSSFGSSGTSKIDSNASTDPIVGLNVESSGKIIFVGNTKSAGGASTFTVGRALSTGGIDNSFGSSGYVKLDFGTAYQHHIIKKPLFMPNGNVFMTGLTYIDNTPNPDYYQTLIKFK